MSLDLGVISLILRRIALSALWTSEKRSQRRGAFWEAPLLTLLFPFGEGIPVFKS